MRRYRCLPRARSLAPRGTVNTPTCLCLGSSVLPGDFRFVFEGTLSAFSACSLAFHCLTTPLFLSRVPSAGGSFRCHRNKACTIALSVVSETLTRTPIVQNTNGKTSKTRGAVNGAPPTILTHRRLSACQVADGGCVSVSLNPPSAITSELLYFRLLTAGDSGFGRRVPTRRLMPNGFFFCGRASEGRAPLSQPSPPLLHQI